MSRTIKRINWWIRRRSHLPVLFLGVGVVLLLVFNEETSIASSRIYDSRIDSLRRAITLACDSADYYTTAREQLFTDPEQLEVVARENYNMQRPIEDIYLIH